jgi:erythromycin esterase
MASPRFWKGTVIRCRRWFVACTATGAVLIALWSGGRRVVPFPPDAATLTALRREAFAFATDSAVPSTKLLLARVAGARIVGLGEGTHGNHEFHTYQAAATKILVEEAGFRLVVLEAPWSAVWHANAFIHGENPAPTTAEDAARALAFPLLASDAVAQVIAWMRDFNDGRAARDQVRLVGMDPQLSFDPIDHGWGATPTEDSVIARQAHRIADQASRLDRTAWRWLQNMRRDADMAENLEWATERLAPNGRAIVWAHNGHLAREWPYLGFRIAKRYGRAYVPIAATAFTGAVAAFSILPPTGIRTGRLVEAPPASIERALHDAGFARAWLDLATAKGGGLASWLEHRQLIRSVGAVLDTTDLPRSFYPTRLAARWDVIVFFDSASASHLLPLAPSASPAQNGGH